MEATTAPSIPSILSAAPRATSWFRPPVPLPATVTVVSPPTTMPAGLGTGFPVDETSWARAARTVPTCLASPSTWDDRKRVWRPAPRRPLQAPMHARRLLPITTL